MTNAERQRAYKARQREQGRAQKTFLVTDEEAFWLERVLLQMRTEGSTPAMMRNRKGQMKALDA